MLKAIFKDSMIYGVADVCFKLLSLATFPIFARLFTVDEYGILSLSLTITGLLSIFYVGVHNAVQRFYWDSKLDEKGKKRLISTGFYFLLGMAGLSTIIFLSVLYPFAPTLEEKFHLSWMQVAIAVLTIIPSQIFVYGECVLRLHFSPWKFTFLAACLNLSNVVATLTLVLYYKMGITGYLMGVFVSNASVSLITVALLKKQLVKSFDTAFIKQILTYGSPFILTSVAYWLFSSMDRWMLGDLADIHEVGLYSVAFKITLLLNMVKSAFGQAWSPHAFKMHGDGGNYREIYGHVFSMWFFILLLCGAGLTFFAPEFFALTTPESYWAATPIVIVSVGGMILYGTTEVTAMGISIARQVKLFTKGSWISALVNLVLNYFWIPKYGAVGAAAATFVSYGVLTLYYFYHSQRLHPIPLDYRKIVFNISSLAVVLWAAFAMSGHPFSYELIALKGILLIGFALLGFLFGLLPTPSLRWKLVGQRG